MKATIVIPTYWRGPASEAPMCTLESDYLYDHATPLDSEGTLGRALDSLSVLKSPEDFAVAVVAASTRREIKQAVELKVQSIIARYDYDFPFLMIGPDELVLWRRRLVQAGFREYDDFLDLDGYANIRNMCLLAAALTDAEVAILFDDDQVFEDPEYLTKALEFVGREHEGSFVAGVTGYYVRPEGGYLAPPEQSEWQKTWGGRKARNEALKIIGAPLRLKPAPLVFGGNMVIHRRLFESVPFDNRIPRGDDLDYMINAMFFGHRFLLDNQLWIRHLPPPRCAPAWHQLRQNIVRFARERAKLATQRPGPGLHAVYPADFDPYPGRFLKDNLHDIVASTSLEMAADYLAAGMEEDAAECMVNIAISKAESRIRGDAFGEYLARQQKWEEFIRLLPQMHIWSPAAGND